MYFKHILFFNIPHLLYIIIRVSGLLVHFLATIQLVLYFCVPLCEVQWYAWPLKAPCLTASTVAPFPVSIVVRCHSTPCSFAVSSCAAVVTAAFVDERERTAISARRPLSAVTYEKKFKPVRF